MPVDARWEPGITNAQPACRPSLAAVCLVIRTWRGAAARLVAGVRRAGARLKSACNEAVIVSIVAGEIDLSSWEAVSYDRRLCTSAQAAETLMVRVVGAIAASVCRAAWVLLARVSRAPAVAAKTARKVSRASQRYSPLGRYRRFTLPPPRGARRLGRGAGGRRARRQVREARRPGPRAGS